MRKAAHDLASLLTVSCGYREKAQRGLAEVMDHLEKARAADERAMQLVREMQAGKANESAPPGIFDMNDVVRELENLEAVSVLITGETVSVKGYPFAMFRALMNLCTNAQNAGATIIKVTSRRTIDNRGCVTVHDNGRGMSAKQLSKLWEPHESDDGMHGHGLAIVKDMVEQHLGEISVASNLGCGSHFSIYLPLAEIGTLAA